MSSPHLKVVGDMPEPDTGSTFFLIVADHDQEFFCVEGPMTDEKPWTNAARRSRDQFGRRVECGPNGPDRNALAAAFQRTHKFAGVPPGSILRPRQ